MRWCSRLSAEGYSAVQSDFRIETAWVRAGSETGTAFKKKKSSGWREKKIGGEADFWGYDRRELQCVRFCGFGDRPPIFWKRSLGVVGGYGDGFVRRVDEASEFDWIRRYLSGFDPRPDANRKVIEAAHVILKRDFEEAWIVDGMEWALKGGAFMSSHGVLERHRCAEIPAPDCSLSAEQQLFLDPRGDNQELFSGSV